MERVSAFLAGSAMGLLTGVFVGLSASPVVGAVLTGLIALLVTFFGFRNTDTSTTANGNAATSTQPRADNIHRTLTVAGFGLFGVVGALLGIFLRAHDALSLTPSERVARWSEAGFDTTRARALTAFQITGIVPSGSTVGSPTSEKGSNTVLLNTQREECDQIDAESLADAGGMRSAFIEAEGEWGSFARSVEGLPSERQRQLMLAAWHLACGAP